MKATFIRTITVCFLLIAFGAVSAAIASAEKNGEKATGPEGRAKAPALEKIEFIHYKKDSGKAKPGTVCGNGDCEPGENAKKCPQDCGGGGGEDPPEATCYAFIGQYGKKYLKWPSPPIPYEINSATAPADASVDEIVFGAWTWDAATSADLFALTDPDSDATYNVQDHINAVCFDDYYLDEDIIGACMVWYNPATKAIVEFDIVFETNWTWGNVDEDGDSVMDLQNIATHELGHALGLADIYDELCSYVTMYGYSTAGETQKRSLEIPDETGLSTLYGE